MKKYFILFAAAAVLASCKKNIITPTPLASFNVTNTVVGGSTLSLNTSTITIPVNGYAEFPLFAGQSKLDLYDPADAAHPYYNQTIPTANGDYYSLFLGGTSPSQVDAVLVRDHFQNYTDTIVGVRLVNMSPGSNPISVNIVGKANGSSVASLPYKGYSDFLTYPWQGAGQTYTFEFRDAASGTLLSSYTFSPLLFHNTTLVFSGLPSAQSVVESHNY